MNKKLLLVLISSILTLALLIFFMVVSWEVFVGEEVSLPVAKDTEKTYPSNYDDSPFGYLMAPSLNVYTGDLGVKWVRMGAQWGLVQNISEVDSGIYNWDDLEEQKNYHKYSGVDFMVTISLLGTPIEASGSYVPNVPPYTTENYIAFVKELVNRYKGNIKYWQVENEPKLKIKDFAELQKITYNTVKEECSECQVIMGGFFWGKGDTEDYDKLNLKNLQELNGKYVDIYDQHYYGDASEYNPKTLLDHAKKRLAEADFNEIPIWITEMGDYSGDPVFKGKIDPPYQTEFVQAGALLKRYISSLSYGVDKIFWAWGLYEGFQHDESYFDFTGLIYDGEYDYDLGAGVKKLSYYTYKLMVEKLEGSDWDNIQTIQESDNVYVYKFTNNEKPIWVAWSDNSGEKKATISGIGAENAMITEAVPKYEAGKEVTNYNTAFKTETKTVSNGKIEIILGESPVFVEEK